MNVLPWDRISEIFEHASGLRPGAERNAFLVTACAGDEALRSELATLLAAHDTPGALDRLGDLLPAELQAALPDEIAPDSTLGPFRLRRRLGHGGMGVVYLAERSDDFHQRVAIKVLRAGPDATDLLPRFLAERRILARLEHPNITRLLDGGITPAGAPYFAMEYVEGAPIDQYCDHHRLTIRQRLALFATLCDAMQYAHQHLVVHRDLKPSNILVTVDGVVKVLDFGIAKLLDTSDGRAAATVTGPRFMTPDYASPEQIRGEHVTTASDVYALGVILFELLAGRRPYQFAGRFAGAQGLLEESPTRPSLVVDEQAAESRATPLGRVRRQIAGDLDTIVLRALHPRAGQRYGTAGALAEDIRRHLSGRPVLARPDTLRYRARKFIARHRLAMVVLAHAAVGLTAAGIATAVSAHRARVSAQRAAIERDRAEAVTRFVVDLFAAADPQRVGGREVTAREVLDSGAARLARDLADQPISRAHMLEVLARSYRGLGRYPEAQRAIGEALSLRRGQQPPDTLALSLALEGLSHLYVLRGMTDSAAPAVFEVLALRRAARRSPDSLIATALNNVGSYYHARGALDSADVFLREAVREWRAVGDSGSRLVSALGNLAGLQSQRGRLAEAESLQRSVLELQRRLLPAGHPGIATALNNLGVTQYRLGNLAAARRDVEAALMIRRATLGEKHPDVANGLHNLAAIVERQADLDSAAALYRSSAAIKREVLGDSHPSLARTLGNLGMILKASGDVAGAESLLVTSLAIRRARLGDDHGDVGIAMNNLALLYAGTGRAHRAEPLQRRAAAILRARLAPDHVDAVAAELDLARTLSSLGRRTEAESLLVALRRMLEAKDGVDGQRLRRVTAQLDELQRGRRSIER